MDLIRLSSLRDRALFHGLDQRLQSGVKEANHGVAASNRADEKGDRVTMGGNRYIITRTSDDATPEEKLAGLRWARTYMAWAGIPPVTEELLAVEPYSEAELNALSDSGSGA